MGAQRVDTLGGLPVEDWVGRLVQLRRQEGRRYPQILAQLVQVLPGGRRAVVKPWGHGHEETVPMTSIRPAWAKNPDLADRRP